LSFKSLAGVLALTLPLLFLGCRSSAEVVYYPNTLHIQNDSTSFSNIWSVYVTPAGAPWGTDLLGVDILQPGDELVVDVYDCDRYYDIRVEYDNGGPIYEDYDVWLPCNTSTYMTYID